MLSYMLPVEEKSPSVTAASAAAARNLSLNLNNPANPGGSSSKQQQQQQFKDAGSVANGSGRVSSSSGKVIKSAIKTNHRYQLVSSSSSSVEENGSGLGPVVANGKKKFSKRNGEEPVHNGGANAGDDLSDEHTSLLGGGKSVKSDKNFNNLIVVNGNVNGGSKLASVLKKNGSSGTTVNGDGPLKVVTTTNGYSAVRSSENDEEDADDDAALPEADYREEDEEFDLVVAANNRKNTGVITAKMSTSASVTRNLNGINGNNGSGAGAAPQQQSSVETPSSGIIVDTSDADSEQTAVSGVSGGGGGGGKKVKMNKLGGSKNVTLKRVSFGSSKGSMVETLVFETPTPLPEHAEREFFHSPAVLAGAGTTVNSVHHYQQHHHHLPHYHHPMQQQQQQGQSQQSDSSLVGLDDSGIELQEEVERSKVRVSFFQSSKPQSISPPESLLFGGGQNLIHFGPGSGGGGGYDNNNTLLDSSYITSAALNQQYDSLLAGHHHNHHSTFQYNPDDPAASMAAVMAYDRQMSTESGWDNPFRPGGDLSREADEIVNLIKGGKPITPTGDQTLLNGSAPKDSSNGPTENGGSTVVDGVATKLESTQLQSQQPNGTKSPQKGDQAAAPTTAASPQKNGSTPAGAAASQSPATTNQTQVSNQVIPGPQSASHVVIDEKKKKKCACCVIQ